MATSTTLRGWWAAWKCTQARLTHAQVFGRPVGGVADVAVEAFAALEQALTVTGYEPDSVWAYNCRPIAGTSVPSLHSYGIAVDIDPRLNEYSEGSPWWGEFTKEQIDAVTAIRNVQGEQLWTWGGYWGTPDRMHFQLNVRPTNCQVDWSTVEDDVAQFTEEEAVELRRLVASLKELDPPSDGSFAKYAVQLVRKERAYPLDTPIEFGVDVAAREEIDNLKTYLRSV